MYRFVKIEESLGVVVVTSLATRSMTGNLTMVSPAVAGITTSNPASH